jgi:hypothetical protein
MVQQSIFNMGLFIIETSRSHSDTPRSVRILWTSDQPDADTSIWQYTTLTRDIRDPSGIRNRNLSKWWPAEPHLRPCGHWDWRSVLYDLQIKSYMNFLPTKLTDHSMKLSQFRKLMMAHLVISFPNIYSTNPFPWIYFNLIFSLICTICQRCCWWTGVTNVFGTLDFLRHSSSSLGPVANATDVLQP